jgi:hypothetical protein
MSTIKNSCSVLIAVLFALFGVKQAQADWRQVGAAGFSAGDATDISLAVDSSGIPYVAYSECMDANCSVTEARVKKLSGSDWIQVGAVAKFTGGNAGATRLAVDKNGTPYVAFSDTNNGGKLRVMKLNGSSWMDVGGNVPISGSKATDISIAVDTNGKPFVAYSECVNGCIDSRVTMATLNGTDWGAFNGAGFSVDAASSVGLALNSSGIPFVAYIHTDSNDTNKIGVIQYSDTGWIQVGLADFAAASIEGNVRLACTSSDILYVAYNDADGKISVKKFSDAGWTQVGAAGFSTGEATDISLAMDSKGTPYVAYSECIDANCSVMEARVKKFSGSVWTQVGAVTKFTGGNADSTNLALDKNGILYVAYSDWDRDYKASAMRFSNAPSAMPWLELLLRKK